MEYITQLHPLLPFVLAAVVGFFAESIFKTTVYGRIVDAVIGLVGGFLLYFPVARYYNAHSMIWGSDLVVSLIFSVIAIVGALVLLYLVRMLVRKRA